MDSLTDQPAPSAANQQDWNEAHQRVLAYLSGFQIGDYAHQSQLLMDILEATRARHAQQPDRPPVELAMAEAQRRIEAWFAEIFAGQPITPAIARHTGAVALFTSNGYRRFGEIFLNPEIDAALRKELTSSAVRTGPDLEISSMIPREFDYGPLETMKETLEKTGWGPVVRAFLFWAFFYVVVYFGWTTLFR